MAGDREPRARQGAREGAREREDLLDLLDLLGEKAVRPSCL